MIRNAGRIAAAALVAAAVGAQFFQPERINPPFDRSTSFETVAKAPPVVVAAVGRGCRDCHSNQTEWPWYSRVAPVSWLVASDVREARARLNLSEWGRFSPDMARLRLTEMCDEVSKGDMPPLQYTLIHRGAKLTTDERSALCAVAR
jgi:hypothetical protein